MELELIGRHPFDRDEQGRQITQIGTVFPSSGVLWTQPPPVHALQRQGYLEHVNAKRAASGQPPLTQKEEDAFCLESVDLIFSETHILIRPRPHRMDLAFLADEILQKLVSKRKIKFLSLSDPRVRTAIKERGEFWRLSSIPKTDEGKNKLIAASRVAVRGRPIYFYNPLTGTRWLTYPEFETLGALPPAELSAHLQEIADHSAARNRLGRPEVDFFATDLRPFGEGQFAGIVFANLPPEQLRAKYEELRDRFRSAVHETFRRHDPKNDAWLKRMVSTLFLEGNDAQTEHLLSGLSPEFFLHIEWLPGGRFEDGEFLFDPIFQEAAANKEDKELQELCDPRTRGIIFNLVRDYGELKFINVGRIPESLSQRPQKLGRRGVYMANFACRSEPGMITRFLRLQKWGVREHLDKGKDMLSAIRESDEYTDYWLDRRLGCRQLRMNLTPRVVMRRLTEYYTGPNTAYQNQAIRSTYFERDYVPGTPTDKVPAEKYTQPGYAAKLAELLGRAAASSIIVGRALEQGTIPLFDDGDEVIQEDEDGLPLELWLGDHSGAFGEYKLPLENFAAHYARPVSTRRNVLPDVAEFAKIYLAAFREQFLHVQGDYRKRRSAFDNLFTHCPYDPGGSLAYRWERVLKRLDQTDVDALLAAIRAHMPKAG
jgi:hypothetical protein